MQTASPPPQRKFPAWTLIKVMLGLLLAALVFSRTDIGELHGLWGRILWPYLVLTLTLYILLSMAKAWQYYRLLGGRVSYPQALSVTILQNAVSNFIATSAGVAAYMTMLKAEQGVKLSRSASIFLLLKVGDVASLGVGLLLSLLFVGGRIQSLSVPILLLTIGILAALVVFGAALYSRGWVARLMRPVLERTGLTRFSLVAKGLGFLDALANLDPHELIRMVGMAASLSLVYFALTMAWTYCALQSFSLPVTVWVVVFVTSMLQLLSIFPIQILGGLGVSEAASLYLFGLFGFAQAELAAVLIGMRVLFYLANLLTLIYLPAYALFSGGQKDLSRD